MDRCGDSRWHERCPGRCGDCVSCLQLDSRSEGVLSKRFVTVGSVRYGVRLGAVSPPPPGAGARYRSKCCWTSTSSSGFASQIPLLAAAQTINNDDIFSCVNNARMVEDATSESLERTTVRGQVLCSSSTKSSSLKNQLKRRALVRPQVYARLCECGEGERADIVNTLDRLPRFRFGGNRNNNTANKERDRKTPNPEQRLKEITERLRKTPPLRKPIGPSRGTSTFPDSPIDPSDHNQTTSHGQNFQADQTSLKQTSSTHQGTPVRSASFSQVDFSCDDGKYVRWKPHSLQDHRQTLQRDVLTLPRPKNHLLARSADEETQPLRLRRSPTTSPKCDSVHSEPPPEPAKSTDGFSFEDAVENSNSGEKRRADKSRRRKGVYISQWPDNHPSEDAAPDAEVPKLRINRAESCPKSTLETPEESRTSDWLSIKFDEHAYPISDDKGQCGEMLFRNDSLSEGETYGSKSEQGFPSDVSDCEVRSPATEGPVPVPRRYSKRPLRGPYGQMLEAEMKKPETGRKYHFNNDLKFLEDPAAAVASGKTLTCSNSVGAGDPKPKYISRVRGASNHSLDDAQFKNCLNSLTSDRQIHSPIKRKVSIDLETLPSARQDSEPPLVVSHQRTTSSPSKLEELVSSNEVTSELLERLLRGSSEQLAAGDNLRRNSDTRTHVVVELFDTERSYVESLQIVVSKYLEPLKSPENAGLLDALLVDEIFFQIPSLLNYHQVFLEELKKRLEHWDAKQKVGDVFLETFSRASVIDSYTNYVNNWKRARTIIKTAQQTKPAFAKFLENTAREHKGKLALDSLLIKPIQKFPKYELLIQRLIKHTDLSHPDYNLLLSAQKEIHDLLLKINCTEREALDLEQLREIENLIEGLIELVAADRQYLRHDLVSMAASGGTRKDRALFLFNDLLLVTSIKRKSGTIRKPTSGQGSVTSTLEANKYKLLMKISLDDLEIVKAKDESLKQMMLEIENLTEDVAVLNQINDLASTLHCNHASLDEIIKEMSEKLNRQLIEQQNSDSQLACLGMTLNTANGLENLSIAFSKPEKRVSWEEAFNEAKHKLAISGDRRPCPELIAAVPIRKTRAGLQFTCAAPAIGDIRKDVWVCNSDGYVGQVCILSLLPEPNVTSCNGVCNARIVCIACVPGFSSESMQTECDNVEQETQEEHNTSAIHFDSSSSSEDDEKSDTEENLESSTKCPASMKVYETASTDSEEADYQQSTMWLGTEDGCIYVYNTADNIRIKKSKIRLQHCYAILSIIYFDNKVYVSLANGDIVIYERENSGSWNTNSPTTISVGTAAMPVSKIIPSSGKLWCGCGNIIKVFNTENLTIDNNLAVNNDINKPITCVVLSGNAVWLALQNSAIVKCFNSVTFELLCEVNVAPAVTKMLTSCDDIIRQHKAACLRVTSLLACKDLLWIGTSAGVLLRMSLPHVTPTTTKLTNIPCVIGNPYGHTGHVRFLTTMEYPTVANDNVHNRYSYKGKPEQRSSPKILVISGGDGYEDFRSANISEVAGREDSTNHLLLWNF